MNWIRLVIIIVLVLVSSGISSAQVSVGGLVDILLKNSGEEDNTNTTFRNYSNFHSSRTRLFFDTAPTENVEVFVQVLVDNYNFQLFGAYVRFSDIGILDLNAQVGLIPHPVGSWGPRTYSNKNPLVGVPLLYNMHSSYIPSGPTTVRTTEDILALRDTRSSSGLPIIYDACWNTGAELYGNQGKWTYSIGLLTGSLSKPTTEQTKDVPQVTTHITYALNSRVTFGGSGFFGPYLMDGADNDSLPVGSEFSDYMSGGIGYEFHYAGRYFELFSEGFHTYWEHPYLSDLKLFSGYVEGKYKFKPGWFVAGRYGIYQPGKIKDSLGEKQYWDYPVDRIECGIGYHPNRKTTIKIVTQLNNYDFSEVLDNELYAFQISVSFD